MKLHDYQEIGRDHLLQHPRAGLFLDMGLGKTATTLAALTDEHLPALVIAPKRVAETVWPVEQKLWRPDLRLSLAAGSPVQRRAAIAADRPITVIGRDNIADVVASKRSYRTVILDELSGFKARSSARWRNGRRLTAKAQHVWGLTGTPSPNGLMDLWAQLYLLDGGVRLGTRLGDFRGRYFVPGRRLPSGVVIEWLPRDETEHAIHRLIDDICLSMESDGRIQLPPVTYNTIEVPLSAGTRRIYKTLKQDLLVDLELIGGEIHTAPTAAALSNRLSQVSAGFIYVDKNEQNVGREGEFDIIHWDKVRAVKEVIDGTGSPVLVFYRYAAEKAMLLKEIDNARLIDERGAIEDWNAGRVPVLLAHPQSAGHGLNLQYGGHTIVWSSLPWSLEEWEQSNKRLARQGQQHPVVIHVLTSPRTVDEAIVQALDRKTSIQRALLDHLESVL